MYLYIYFIYIYMVEKYICTDHGLGCRKSPLPADVNESRCDDDHTDGANDYQNHKQLPIVTAGLTGLRVTTTGRTVVLDSHLSVHTHKHIQTLEL